jgi:hypothetical protein
MALHATGSGQKVPEIAIRPLAGRRSGPMKKPTADSGDARPNRGHHPIPTGPGAASLDHPVAGRGPALPAIDPTIDAADGSFIPQTTLLGPPTVAEMGDAVVQAIQGS